MRLLEDATDLVQFQQYPWNFQQTFETPLKDLRNFAQSILSANQQITGGSITIDTWVFEPTHLIELLKRHSIPPQYKHGVKVVADDEEEAIVLLEASLGDWLDFIFMPSPAEIVIYADHDEFTTFFARQETSLSRVAEALSSRGYKMEKYERKF